jgi:hypothetical protein
MSLMLVLAHSIILCKALSVGKHESERVIFIMKRVFIYLAGYSLILLTTNNSQ